MINLVAVDRIQPALDEPDPGGAAGLHLRHPCRLLGICAGWLEDGPKTVQSYGIYSHNFR